MNSVIWPSRFDGRAVVVIQTKVKFQNFSVACIGFIDRMEIRINDPRDPSVEGNG